MSVFLEFSISAQDFNLGNVLSAHPGMEIELERVVPTGKLIMPFIWVTGEEQPAFVDAVRSQSGVSQFVELDSIGDSSLYRIEWENPPTDLIRGIADSEAVVLEARGREDWTFQLRFPDHEKLSTFHNYTIEHEIPVHIERTYTLTESTDHGHRFDLSPEQREALVMALQKGYFETPKEVSLDDLAAELGISRQALSNRIRRANRKVLGETML